MKKKILIAAAIAALVGGVYLWRSKGGTRRNRVDELLDPYADEIDDGGDILVEGVEALGEEGTGDGAGCASPILGWCP